MDCRRRMSRIRWSKIESIGAQGASMALTEAQLSGSGCPSTSSSHFKPPPVARKPFLGRDAADIERGPEQTDLKLGGPGTSPLTLDRGDRVSDARPLLYHGTATSKRHSSRRASASDVRDNLYALVADGQIQKQVMDPKDPSSKGGRLGFDAATCPCGRPCFRRSGTSVAR